MAPYRGHGFAIRTSRRRCLCGWQRVPLSLTQRYPNLQWVVASAANYYKVGDKRPPCRFLHFIPKRGRLSKRHPLSHFRACRLKMSKWCVNVLVFNCKSVNRKFFFTPLARICNPCYDIMARIANPRQRSKQHSNRLKSSKWCVSEWPFNRKSVNRKSICFSRLVLE